MSDDQVLVTWLKTIGKEVCPDGLTATPDGEILSYTNDEMLARMIWKRALGWRETIRHEDGSMSVIDHSPDIRAQQFIFERREGKFVQPVDKGEAITPADRLSDVLKYELNKTALAITDDATEPDITDAHGTIPENGPSLERPNNRVNGS